MPGGQGLYRQTWLSGGHVQTTSQQVVVTVRFGDEPDKEHRRVYEVPPWGRWSLLLDELRAGFVGTVDALARIVCEGQCWAEKALWHSPIGRGVVPTVTPVLFACQP